MLFGILMPGLDVKPMLEELRARVVEELDYRLEATAQQAFADAYAGDPDIAVPSVIAATDHVLVTEWMDGTPLAQIIASGTQEQRDAAGMRLVRFLFSGPARAGLLHADPHPGNFRLLPDGRLGVLDFGAVDRLPDGLPRIFGKLLWLMHHDGDIATVESELREHGFLRPGVTVKLDELHAFLAPLAEPSRGKTFSFSREWMRGEAARVADLRSANAARRLNLPPSYVLIHRVSTAGIGVLCQLECSGEFRAEVLQWIPGYGPPDGAPAAPRVVPSMDTASMDAAGTDAVAKDAVGKDAAGKATAGRAASPDAGRMPGNKADANGAAAAKRAKASQNVAAAHNGAASRAAVTKKTRAIPNGGAAHNGTPSGAAITKKSHATPNSAAAHNSAAIVGGVAASPNSPPAHDALPSEDELPA
jgi:hypothetical protein